MPNLSMLVLDYNRIENIPTKDEIRKLKRLAILRIQDNNFICSCKLHDFVQWMKNNSAEERREDYVEIPKQNLLRCSSKLKWIDIVMSEKQTSTECPLPRIEITAKIGKERQRDWRDFKSKTEKEFGVNDYQELHLIENKTASVICRVTNLENIKEGDFLALKIAMKNGTRNG